MRYVSEEVEQQVLRRAGNRCEGWIDDPRMKRSSERCTARKDLDFQVGFWAAMSDDPYSASDVSLLCQECADNSDTAHEWEHFHHMCGKDD